MISRCPFPLFPPTSSREAISFPLLLHAHVHGWFPSSFPMQKPGHSLLFSSFSLARSWLSSRTTPCSSCLSNRPPDLPLFHATAVFFPTNCSCTSSFHASPALTEAPARSPPCQQQFSCCQRTCFSCCTSPPCSFLSLCSCGLQLTHATSLCFCSKA